MPISAAGNENMKRPARGFTLLELLVVLAIIALATAGVSLALPDSHAAQLQREGERLAALLEAARAQSRASGQAVRWRADAQGFHFEGLADPHLPSNWLNGDTVVLDPGQLWLGPEPLIGPQQVLLAQRGVPQRSVRVATDGLRPFQAEPAQPRAPGRAASQAKLAPAWRDRP